MHLPQLATGVKSNIENQILEYFAFLTRTMKYCIKAGTVVLRNLKLKTKIVANPSFELERNPSWV